VDPANSVTDFSACGVVPACSDGLLHPDIASVLTAVVASSPPQDEFQLICVLTSGTHEESVVIDNSLSAYGSGVGIGFFGATLQNHCPDPATSVDQPAFVLVGDPSNPNDQSLGLNGLVSDQALCPSGPRPLQSVTSASGGILNGRLLHAAGPVFAANGTGTSLEVDIDSSRIEGAAGALYVGSTALTVNHSEFSAIDGADGVPLIDLTGLNSSLTIGNSAIFGSVARSAPLVRTEGDVSLIRSVLAGNAVTGDESLVEMDVSRSSTSPLLTIDRSVLSRNQLLGAGAPVPAPIIGRSVAVPGPGEFCLPIGSDGEAFAPRDTADAAGASLGLGALFRVIGAPTALRPHFLARKSFFVDNLQATGAALLQAEGTLSNFQASLVHNTVALDGGVLVADLAGSGGGLRLASVRNLYASAPALSLGPTVEVVEASLDAVVGGLGPWWGALSGAGLRGPDLGGPGAWTPLDPADPSLSDDCGRASQTCPELLGACGGLFAGGNERFCPYDSAVEWIPAAADFVDLRPTWPWTGTSLPQLADGDLANAAGATGLECDLGVPFWDQISLPGGLMGDDDLFTALVDCDNDDGAVFPVLPDYDGFSDPACDPVGGGCYSCPDGSIWPPSPTTTTTPPTTTTTPPTTTTHRTTTTPGRSIPATKRSPASPTSAASSGPSISTTPRTSPTTPPARSSPSPSPTPARRSRPTCRSGSTSPTPATR